MKNICIYNPYLDTKGGGEKVCLALASELSKDHRVSIVIHRKIDLEDSAAYFDIDLSRVKLNIIKMNAPILKVIRRLPIPRSLKNYTEELWLYRKLKSKNYDLFINNCFHSNLPNPGRTGVYMCMFPQKLEKEVTKNLLKKGYRSILHILYKYTLYQSKRHSVDTYDLITANSLYTQKYVKKFWGLNSKILYPICDSMLSQNIKKEKIILSVGRFFENLENNHHKRQDFLLEEFIKMKKMHKQGWELHFAGTVEKSKSGAIYIVSLMNMAKNYPVVFHFDCGFNELKYLYNQASIYWHATGYGSDIDKYPEKQEHFGITTVEAMSAGAIPVVINSAGQKESVIQGKTGYLWNNQDELIKYTNKVAEMDSSSSDQLSKTVTKRAERFNSTAFSNQVKDIFDQFIS